MASLEPEKTLGGYTLNRRIARGGMGEIWLAERKGISGFSRQVVIKTILEHFIEEPELVRMFLDEGRVAAGLSHPNIAQTYDLGEAEDIYYIAMEYVHGHDLREWLLAHAARRQLIPLNLVLRIASQVCEGLHYAHTAKNPDGSSAGIVHRDISPHNILVTFSGNAKIVDFGIARTIEGVSQTRSGVLKGKCAYMSPEQIQGQDLDGRSDVFALGVVLYELITGRRLFKRNSELATLDAVVRSAVPPPTKLDATVPKPVEKLVLKALKRDRSKRFASARAMQLAIDQVMHETGLLASSAHLSAYMGELFSDDVDANRRELKEIKRKLSTDSGQSASSSESQLERSGPFSPDDLEEGDGPTKGTSMPTRNMRPGNISKRGGNHGWWSWLAIAGLLAIVAIGGWYLFSGQTEQEPDENTEPSVPDAGSPANLDGQAMSSADGGDSDSVSSGPPDGGPEDGVTASGDPSPSSLRGADSKPGPAKRKKRRKKKTKPTTADDPDMDIILER